MALFVRPFLSPPASAMHSHFAVMLRAVVALSIAAPMGAQQDSIDTSAPHSGNGHVVILIDSLDRAAFANVSELLQARVPGLVVSRTGDGATRWFMRGPASVWETFPLVLVDDVRIGVAGSGMRDLGTRPPLLDELDLEDVERIEVMSGPATAIRYGAGAGNGVIRIMTFAPRAQATSFRLATSATRLDENVMYPTNANRPGVDSAGGAVPRCTLQLEANDLCTPSGPIRRLNALESDSPFEAAFGTRMAATVASGHDRLAWRGGATFDHQRSTAGTLGRQRVHVRGATAIRITRTADVIARANWMRGAADLPVSAPLNRSILTQGLLARADTAWPGFVQPARSPYDATRYGASADGGWRPRDWLDVRLTSGIQRLVDENDLEYGVTSGFFGRLDVDMRGERRRRDANARLDAVARYGIRALDHESVVTIEYAASRHEEEVSEYRMASGDTVGWRIFWINGRTAIAGVGLVQRVRLGWNLELVGGMRLDQVRLGDQRWDVPPSPHLAISWETRPSVLAALSTLRIRAALGDIANVPQTLHLSGVIFPVPPGGSAAERPEAAVTRERELGTDATLLDDRLILSFTWYKKRTSNVVAPLLGPQPSQPYFDLIEVLNRGIEASVRARLLHTARLTWDARAWYAYNHNEVTRGGRGILEFSEPFSTPVAGTQWVASGQPLGALRSQPIVAVRDLDGDGLIDNACYDDPSCEVVVSRQNEFRPAHPPTTASLATSLRLGALTVSALIDHRSGHVMDNVTMRARCFRECEGLYDPATSLRNQAETFLASSFSTGTSVLNAGYTKLREISLRVDGPAQWARALGGSRLAITLAGRNIATWTEYRGLDPETTSSPWIPLASIDDAATPLPRALIVRVELSGRQ